MRRHRAAVALAAGGGVVLVAFVAATVAQSREVRRALQADRERARAERVSQFLVEVFRAADPMSAGTGTSPPWPSWTAAPSASRGSWPTNRRSRPRS